MYKTKVYHGKNSKDYLAIKDPYIKKPYVKSSNIGMQFQTIPPKNGQTAGYFSKKTYSISAYQTGTKYLEHQPRDNRKMGFGSHDAKRRDEFTLDIRARQWKEKLKTENEFLTQGQREGKRAQTAPLSAAGDRAMAGETQVQRRRREYTEKYADRPELFQTQAPWNLYDVGKDAMTPICNKCSRETWYCRHRVQSQNTRRPGTAPTTYEVYGNFENYPVEKPIHGNVNELKHFYDHSHLAPAGAKYTY